MTRRTTIDIDDELLGQAQAALGTSGLKDTVDAAFREVARRALRDRLTDRVRSGRGIDRGPEHFERVRPTR